MLSSGQYWHHLIGQGHYQPLSGPCVEIVTKGEITVISGAVRPDLGTNGKDYWTDRIIVLNWLGFIGMLVKADGDIISDLFRWVGV